ncbi:MAG TPA: IPT/TIG domain-containing protein, partial [Candidatus Acidoferrales bacterium]|nr:IPT/TIG domain-containing protein [Candidatus Acidoferrales bacterium]
SITGSQAGITVNPAAASTLTVTGFPNPATAGAAANFTATAKDALNNTATGYRGTVHLTSSDPAAVLPADYTFTAGDAGVHVFSATLKTAGTQSLTATDTVTASITGTQAGITIQNPQPVITPPFAPASATAGGATFTLTINGSNFVNGARVDFGSDKGLVPSSTTAVQIQVSIPAADIATAGTPNVVVNNPAPTAGPSAPQAFTINNPAPTINANGAVTSTGATHGAGGTAFTLTVNGTGFVKDTGSGKPSTVNFSGKAETTTFVSSTQLTAAIPAGDVSTAGTVNVTVTNPAPVVAPGTSPAIQFTLDGFAASGPPAPTMVKAGDPASITITVTPTANGFANQVSFSVTGLPAHTTAAFNPPMITPNGIATSTTLMITTTANGAVPPGSPREPASPLPMPLVVLWFAALSAGLYAGRLIRRTPQLRRYAAVLSLSLLLGTGALLAGCGFGGMNGTPTGNANLTVTATSGTLSQATQVTLDVTP